MLQSAALRELSLAQAASSILQAAYGSSAGVTVVAGDDAIWTCLPAGVAARIALRHLPLFERAENDRLAAQQVTEAIQECHRAMASNAAAPLSTCLHVHG